jgi:hypothetical protein
VNRHFALVAVLVTALTMAAAASAQHGAPAKPQPSGSASLQGGDQQAFLHNPFIHKFYDLSVATLKGSSNVDLGAYEQKSYAIFRDFGPSMGMTPDQMQDHLKLIPRQVAQIAKEDPKVLDSFDNFIEALVGPK